MNPRVYNLWPARTSTVRAVYAISAVLLIWAMVWSIRLAGADYNAAQPDEPALARACQLASGSAEYRLRRAAVREIEEPGDPAIDSDIERALALNPRYAEAWIARAIRNESRGADVRAESDYVTAASVNHMYKPAWALANYYVRRGQIDKFWVYARKCLEIVEPRRLEPNSYNLAPIFDLAWNITRDSDLIRRNLIPHRHFVLVDYLEYLGEHGQAEAGADIAMDLAAYGDPGDTYYLLNYCDRLIHLAHGSRAMHIWNAMVEHATVRGDVLDPVHGKSLTNGDLKRPFERVGFDWRLPPAEGVTQNHFPDASPDGGELRFEFSGDQSEGVLAAYQSIPVVPEGVYRLTFRYQTAGMQHANGLSWQLWDYAGQRRIPVSCSLNPQPEWTAAEARFTIPKGVSVVRLGLVSERAIGSTRIRGTAVFDQLRLQLETHRERQG